LPPAGSSQPLSRPLVQQQPGLPIWLQALSPTENPFASEFNSYWEAAGWNSLTGAPGPFATLPTANSKSGSGNNRQEQTSSSAQAAGSTSGSSSSGPKFDGCDRLCLSDGWFLIRGDNAFFMELAGTEADVQPGSISTSS